MVIMSYGGDRWCDICRGAILPGNVAVKGKYCILCESCAKTLKKEEIEDFRK